MAALSQTDYLLSVGMEVHAELRTNSKMFCPDEVRFGGEPNTRVSPVSLGLPGSLPVPNRRAIEMVLRTALALNCQIAMESVFHRKHYFYPDLPKGYQISQYGETNPLGYYGFLEIPTADGGLKQIKIQRVHLEEDTGKLLHLPTGGSGVDYNRAGLPLMEIVSGFPPDIESPEEAKEYLVRLRQILLYLGVCDGKMEQGSMRCEPNISVRPVGCETFGTKAELKNLNSFTSVMMGVEFERARMIEALERGETLRQETRGWNENTLASYVMRVKESEQDYRYFPDPDLAPMHFTPEYIDELRASIPELPLSRMSRYMNDLGLSRYDSDRLTESRAWSDFFDSAVSLGGEPKTLANWMGSDFARLLNETGQGVGDEDREETKITPGHLVELTKMIEGGAISGKIAKEVFEECFKSGDLPSEVVKVKGLTQISDTDAISAVVAEVLQANPGPLGQYLAGKESTFGFFVGQVMKKTQGRANPALLQEEIRRQLEALKS
jgi:aspartyl-tRNA(Asn)/glutamyl-tRNA(Gln) amidotransferase subunit B